MARIRRGDAAIFAPSRGAATALRLAVVLGGAGDHEAEFGFTVAGRMRDVGRKFGRLLDTVYLQRALDGDEIA